MEAQYLRLLLELAIGLFTIGGSWTAVRFQVRAAQSKAEEARTTAVAAHRRLDEIGARLIEVRSDFVNNTKRIDDALRRVETELQRLNTRLDKVLERS